MARRKCVYRFFMWGPFPTSHSKQWKSRHWKLLRPSGEGPDKFKLKFTVKRHFPLHIISSPAIILQCNANDSFALAIKLLRHDPVSIWLRTRMNNIFQCVLCCGFRSRNLSTWQQKLQETARAHVSFQSICPIFGQPHQTLNKVWNILPCFSPTSLNAEQDLTKWKIFGCNAPLLQPNCMFVVAYCNFCVCIFAAVHLCDICLCT